MTAFRQLNMENQTFALFERTVNCYCAFSCTGTTLLPLGISTMQSNSSLGGFWLLGRLHEGNLENSFCLAEEVLTQRIHCVAATALYSSVTRTDKPDFNSAVTRDLMSCWVPLPHGLRLHAGVEEWGQMSQKWFPVGKFSVFNSISTNVVWFSPNKIRTKSRSTIQPSQRPGWNFLFEGF